MACAGLSSSATKQNCDTDSTLSQNARGFSLQAEQSGAWLTALMVQHAKAVANLWCLTAQWPRQPETGWR